MRECSWFRSLTRKATGAGRLKLMDHGLLIVCFPAMFLIGIPFSPLPSTAAEPAFLVRNDQAPLKADYEVGRFGGGRLYFDEPVDLAVNEDGDLYVLDAGNYRVQVITEKGRFKAQWGKRGEGDGFFDEPVALSINPDSTFLVILDQGTFQVNQYDLDGNHQRSFGEEGSRKGMFDNPVDLTVDMQDYIYVVDRGRSRVLKYHKSGAFIEEWGEKGRPEEQLADPVSIAFSDVRTGVISVLDAGRGAILRYGRDGRFIDLIELPPSLLDEGMDPLKMESDGGGDLFVLDANGGKLLKLDQDGFGLFQLRSEKIPLQKARGLAVDEEGRVLVTDIVRHRIYRFFMEMD